MVEVALLGYTLYSAIGSSLKLFRKSDASKAVVLDGRHPFLLFWNLNQRQRLTSEGIYNKKSKTKDQKSK